MTCDRYGVPLEWGRCPRCAVAARSSSTPLASSPLPGVVPFAEWAKQQDGFRGGEGDQVAPARAEGASVRLVSGRGTAMLCAAAWGIPYGLVMLISASMTASTAYHHYVSNPDRWGPPPPYMRYMLIAGGLVWLVCTVAEVLLARSLGSAYPPLGPFAGMRGSALPRVARRAAHGLDRRLGNGGGCMALIAVMVAGPVLVFTWSFVSAHAMGLWLLVLAAAAGAHLVRVARTARRRRGDRSAEEVSV